MSRLPWWAAPAMTDELQRELPALLPRIWRFAMRLTRDVHDAEDLVQRCCLRALEKRAQWQPGTHLLNWLMAIEYSIWMNELRSAQRRRLGSLDADPDRAEREAGASPHGDPEAGLHYRQVVAAVESLPEAQRVVMLLVAVEGLSYREAADLLDVPVGTVMSRLSRGRALVGQKFLRGRGAPATVENHRHEG
jgi:RNA polymerase sigma-70 factor, ECF subfamily